MLRLLCVRMRARGHSPLLLKKCVMGAADRLESDEPSLPQQEAIGSRERIFLHLQCHPNGISRRELRAAFDATCDDFRGTPAEVEQVTAAFSGPPNLKDRLTSARLREVAGEEVVKFRPSSA